jgi:putative endonuclease
MQIRRTEQSVPTSSYTYRVNLIKRIWLASQQQGLLRLGALAQRIHPRYEKAPHLLTGERGEFEALFYLRRLGFQVVERRWRAPDLRGDIDLIAWEGKTLACIEVKTRTAHDLTPALSAVDDVKRRTLRDLAKAYRRTIPRDPEVRTLLRFDVVSIYLLEGKVECEILRSAFPTTADATRNQDPRYGV